MLSNANGKQRAKQTLGQDKGKNQFLEPRRATLLKTKSATATYIIIAHSKSEHLL